MYDSTNAASPRVRFIALISASEASLSILIIKPMLRRTSSVSARAAIAVSATMPSSSNISATLTTEVTREPRVDICFERFRSILQVFEDERQADRPRQTQNRAKLTKIPHSAKFNFSPQAQRSPTALRPA